MSHECFQSNTHFLSRQNAQHRVFRAVKSLLTINYHNHVIDKHKNVYSMHIPITWIESASWALRGERDYAWLRGLRHFHWGLRYTGADLRRGVRSQQQWRADAPAGICAKGRQCDGQSEGCKWSGLKDKICASWPELYAGRSWRTSQTEKLILFDYSS